MSNKIQNTVFYILIIDGQAEDHSKLREVINKLIPQSYIESIYSEKESASYFRNLRVAPSFIILDAHTQNNSLRLTIYMIRQNEQLKQVPIVIVNSDLNLNQKRELKFLGVNEFYASLSNPIEMRILTNDIKSRWLLPRGD
jgi:PleD family two-component response regulator